MLTTTTWFRAINQAWPGNETIGTWLEAYDNGVANGPTEEQIQNAIHILQQGFWDFDNPNPSSGSGPDFTATSEWFSNFWTSLGFDPSNNPAPYDFSALVGAFTPEQLNGDWTALVSAFDPSQFPVDWTALVTVFGPAQLTADWVSLGAALDPTTMVTEWAAMLAGVGL